MTGGAEHPVHVSRPPEGRPDKLQRKGISLSSAAHGLVHLVRISRSRFASSSGQGTVEYVGLILLVSLLMVGMVAAMKGFSGESGLDIAEVIVAKIKSAVQAITFSD